MHNLGQEIVASFEARIAGIASLREEVKTQLGELGRNHQSMARQMRGALAQGRSELRATVNAQLHGLDQGHTALAKAEARRQGEVHTWLKEVDQAHLGMATGLRDSLVRGRDQLCQAEAQRQAAVQALMKHVAAERAAGRKEWESLVHTRAAKRNGAAAVSEAPVRPRPAAEEEEAVARAGVGSVTEELRTLGDRVFKYLANHPDGARLTEIEREFGLGRLQAGRVMRHLMDEGKAEKRDLCYFAT
jgi:phage gp16-like protein